MLRLFLEWLVEQKSWVAIVLAALLFAITLILRYGYDTWWPFGIVLATLLGLIGMIGNSK